MATATLVFVSHQRLRYLVSTTQPATIVLSSSGGASPDLFSDTLAGPLKQLIRALESLPREVAREHWLARVGVGMTRRSGDLVIELDADIDSVGRVQLVLTLVGAGTVYLDLEA